MSDSTLVSADDTGSLTAKDGADTKEAVCAADGTPVISIVGWSGSGKTTFLEKVVVALGASGLRVGIIKHHAHTTSIDIEGKDSWRYGQAGANPVVVSSPAEYSIIRKAPVEKTLAELAAEIADECDLILTEGYRDQAATIIEFRRSTHRSDAICSLEKLCALVCDDASTRTQAEAAGVAAFDLNDPQGVALYIENNFT